MENVWTERCIVYMRKEFQAAVLKKKLSEFCYFKGQKKATLTLFTGIPILLIFKFCPLWAVRNGFQGRFSRS